MEFMKRFSIKKFEIKTRRRQKTLLEFMEKQHRTKWTQLIHPIPSSIIKITREEKKELEIVLFNQKLELCGFLDLNDNDAAIVEKFC